MNAKEALTITNDKKAKYTIDFYKELVFKKIEEKASKGCNNLIFSDIFSDQTRSSWEYRMFRAQMFPFYMRQRQYDPNDEEEQNRIEKHFTKEIKNQIIQLLEDNGFLISNDNIYWVSDKAKECFNQRKALKEEYDQLENKLREIKKNPPPINKIELREFNQTIEAIKIKMDSIYSMGQKLQEEFEKHITS